MLNRRLRAVALAAVLALLSLPATVNADTGTISYTPPTAYTNGTALPASQISGFDAQCISFTPTGGTSGTCSFTPASVAGTATSITITVNVPSSGGSACFQVRAKTTNGQVSSWADGDKCKVFTPLVPNPPGNVTVAVVVTINVVPAYKILADGTRSQAVAGFVPLGKPCVGSIVFIYRGKPYRRVAQADVKWWATAPAANVAAACG